MSYLLFFGLIPPIILLIYIYKLDKIEKEPPKMILRLFLYGIFSVLPAMFLEAIGFAVLLIMSVEFALLSPLFGLVISWFSRRAEYRADAQAVKEGCGPALVSALKKLARENFSDLSPSPILVALEYSHPTLSRRIAAIEALRGGQA